jgi:hypothetical protein
VALLLTGRSVRKSLETYQYEFLTSRNRKKFEVIGINRNKRALDVGY